MENIDPALLLKYVSHSSLILIPALIFLGIIIKRTPRVPSWIIPFVLTLVGVALSIGLNGLHVESVVQGILVAGVSVLGNEMVKQVKVKNDLNKEE